MESGKSTDKPKIDTDNLSRVLLGEHKTVMVDLHGLSTERAQQKVTHYMKEAKLYGWNKIRFVTGRGNHVNARGERGTLYKSFKEWLQAIPDNIAKVDQFDGYYEVDIKNDIPFRNPLLAFMTENIVQSLKDSIAEIKAGAEKGDIYHMTALALCYDQGIAVAQNYHDATKLYTKLAEQKIASAQYEIGCRCFIGKGIKQDDEKALKFLKLSADQDYMPAQFLLGEINRKGFDNFVINNPLANDYYRKAAEKGHAESARKLGCAYQLGLGIKVDYAQAIHWWEKAVKADDCVAAFNLSYVYNEAKGVAKDPKKAFDYLLLSAELGDPDGQFLLGQTYYFGKYPAEQKMEEGLRWLQRSADIHCPSAQFFLFLHYSRLNESVTARKYLIDAADNDHIEAQFLIATFAQNLSEAKESKITSDKIKKLFEFKPDLQEKMMQRLLNQPISVVLQAGNDAVKYTTVDLLLCDDSTNKQIKKGVQILEKMAEEKYPEVYARLGAIYVLGNIRGIPKDIKRGCGYWLKGAELEDSDCLCSLGYFWQYGEAGNVNLRKALEYFSKAAARDNANANNQLGVFYSNDGYEVKKDFKQAAMYFERAMKLDHPAIRNKKRRGFRNTLKTFKHASKNLAMLYLKGGENFPKDEAKGIELLKQSAADGLCEAAVLLVSYYTYKNEFLNCAYYIKIAADLGDEKAIKSLRNMPLKFRELIEQRPPLQFDNEVPEIIPTKEKRLEDLKRISNCLGEQLEWKITTEKHAWTYVSDSLQKRLKQVSEIKDRVKKATNGKYLILIKEIYHCNMVVLGELFKKVNNIVSLQNPSAMFADSSNSSSNLSDGKADVRNAAVLPPSNPVSSATGNNETHAHRDSEPPGSAIK